MSGPISLAPGPVRVVSMRLLLPFIGVWLAELELDPAQVDLAPTSGKVTITVGEPTPILTLTGTIDPRGSGAFVGVVRLRVLGGAAGWDQTVAPQHFHSDAGILSTRVYAGTAQGVGETANVLAPTSLGPDFVRAAGPASRVLEGETWWVDFAGVTQIGARPTPTADPSLTLITWDPTIQSGELTCDTAVLPGTVITDARIPGGSVTVRDVEQHFDAQGSRVTVWCAQAGTTQLMNDLRAMVVEFSGRKFLQTHLYRIVSQNDDGRLQLQAVHKTAGIPDTLPIAPWTGLSGAKVKYGSGSLGSLVRLAFLEGDPGQPIVDSYQPGITPRETTVDAIVALHLGPSVAAVDLAGGGTALVVAPWAAALASALETFANAVNTAAVGPLAPLAAPASALATAVGSLPAPATTKVTAQ
jgi:hypothetical protein